MRAAFAACLLITACATTARAPAERLAGCWIDRNEAGGAVTMRWLPDQTRPGVLTGDKLTYGADGSTQNVRFTLEPSEAGSSLCELGADAAATQCWVVAEGQGGSLEGGRAFIDATNDRMRITIIGDGPDRLIFAGARDGCD